MAQTGMYRIWFTTVCERSTQNQNHSGEVNIFVFFIRKACNAQTFVTHLTYCFWVIDYVIILTVVADQTYYYYL